MYMQSVLYIYLYVSSLLTVVKYIIDSFYSPELKCTNTQSLLYFNPHKIYVEENFLYVCCQP